MGGSNSREPTDYMEFKWPRKISGLCFETEEKDPVIDSIMEDKTLKQGHGRKFAVSYKAFKGPVTITLTQENEGHPKMSVKENDLISKGTFEFTIKAYPRNEGTYTVEVLDQTRRETCSANPVKVSWKVTVTK